mgnify:FL=1
MANTARAIMCAGCGAKINRSEAAGTFCVKCYTYRFKGRELKDVKLVKCPRCGRISYRQWMEPEKLLEVLKEKLKTDKVRLIGEDRLLQAISTEGIEIEMPRLILFEEQSCRDCNRRYTGYFEAILQLRGDYEKRADRIIKMLREQTFLPKIEDMKDGLDIFVGEKRALNQVLTELHLKALKSYKLHGQKQGKRIYRTTYCVRF